MKAVRFILLLTALAFAVTAAAICVAGVTMTVHPLDTAAAGTGELSRTDLSAELASFENNSRSDALQELTYIPKIYTIAPDASAGEIPNPACYGSSTDPADVETVIAQAARLLGDDELAWNRDLPFKSGYEFSWYLDDTIFVLNWAEYSGGFSRYCSEVKLAHPSQFRRMLSGGSYGSSIETLCSSMADAANAVLASNGDFYLYRGYGINVYDGTLYRCNLGLDTCFVDSEGNLLLYTKKELVSEENVQKIIEDNGVSFTLSFGPVLVRDGEPVQTGYYPVGENNAPNIRSVIGQKGELHYLLVLSGSTTVSTIRDYMLNYGCDCAYCMDGGQTGEHRFNGSRLNPIMVMGERQVSDIIYFATAYPYHPEGQK